MQPAILCNYLSTEADEGSWIRLLIKLGAHLAKSEELTPITAVLCIPRLEYAGLLIASGACIQQAYATSLDPDSCSWMGKIPELVGRRIAYSYKGKNRHVYWEGVLLPLEPQCTSKAIIQNNSLGHIDQVVLDDLHRVLLDTECQDEVLGVHTVGKNGVKDQHATRLRAQFTEDIVGELCTLWNKITLVGVKNRLIDELTEIPPLAHSDNNACTFTDLLRPSGINTITDSVVTQLLSPKDLTAESAKGIVIIEGSRRLFENLRATKNNHRVVLLGRNEPHYSDSADIVNHLFGTRTSDLSTEAFDCPPHIKLNLFHHLT